MTAPSTHPVELLKQGSQGLRGPLAEELHGDAPGFGTDAAHLLKFHGMYQQKDRDKGPAPKPPTLLVRGKIPGGRLRAHQWLAWDGLADAYGDGTLRLTTRQGIELHGVVKGDVPATLRALHAALQTTQGACGDVVRNVTQPPNPWGRADLAQLDAVADAFTAHFQVRSTAYAELFLDGEAVAGADEPFYGATYLPRKFKIALTLAGENAVDLLSNDLGLAATLDGAGVIDGWFVFAGGGMGMTHKDPETFPRLADLVGWVPAQALLAVSEAVIAVQRDFGGRTNRKRARLKYLLHDRGAAWLRAEVEARTGATLEARPLPPWGTPSSLGWHARPDGTWALGLHTLSGRLADTPGRPLRTALRELVRDLKPDLQLTPDQDLILLGLRPGDRAEVEARLAPLGVLEPHPVLRRALACVALPLCGVAITEGERAAPDLLADLASRLDAHGLTERSPLVRLTGCPNGCARPYDAELGIVGQGVGTYALFLGGHPEGDRLAFLAAEKVPLADIGPRLEPLLSAWAQTPGLGLGDFAWGLGEARVRALLAAPVLAEVL